MFFIKEKPRKSNAGKIILISVSVTLGILAAIYGVYVFCRKYCSLCTCGNDDLLDEDFSDCNCGLYNAEDEEDNSEN